LRGLGWVLRLLSVRSLFLQCFAFCLMSREHRIRGRNRPHLRWGGIWDSLVRSLRPDPRLPDLLWRPENKLSAGADALAFAMRAPSVFHERPKDQHRWSQLLFSDRLTSVGPHRRPPKRTITSQDSAGEGAWVTVAPSGFSPWRRMKGRPVRRHFLHICDASLRGERLFAPDACVSSATPASHLLFPSLRVSEDGRTGQRFVTGRGPQKGYLMFALAPRRGHRPPRVHSPGPDAQQRPQLEEVHGVPQKAVRTGVSPTSGFARVLFVRDDVAPPLLWGVWRSA